VNIIGVFVISGIEIFPEKTNNEKLSRIDSHRRESINIDA
jgi:hypothetical protein